MTSNHVGRWTVALTVLMVGLLLPACNIPKEGAGPETTATFTSEVFGTMPDGQEALIYTLTNSKGEEVRITNYGGIVVSLKVPDKDGNLGDVVLG